MIDTDLIIRRAEAQDANAAAALMARVFAATYGAVIPPTTLKRFLESAFAPKQVADQLKHADSTHLVALSGGTIIGISKLVDSAPEGHHLENALELARLYVDPAFHGRGVAAALLEDTLAAAREQGYATIWLCVWERNTRALAFYRKFGFEAFGYAPVLVDDVRFEDVLMRRNLDDC